MASAACGAAPAPPLVVARSDPGGGGLGGGGGGGGGGCGATRKCPPLPLLLIQDEPQIEEENPAEAVGLAWASTRPPAYLEWSYRHSVWAKSATAGLGLSSTKDSASLAPSPTSSSHHRSLGSSPGGSRVRRFGDFGGGAGAGAGSPKSARRLGSSSPASSSSRGGPRRNLGVRGSARGPSHLGKFSLDPESLVSTRAPSRATQVSPAACSSRCASSASTAQPPPGTSPCSDVCPMPPLLPQQPQQQRGGASPTVSPLSRRPVSRETTAMSGMSVGSSPAKQPLCAAPLQEAPCDSICDTESFETAAELARGSQELGGTMLPQDWGCQQSSIVEGSSWSSSFKGQRTGSLWANSATVDSVFGPTASSPSEMMDTSAQLGAAAELAGERARGAVSARIRAKAVVRLAGAQATRRMLHLGGGAADAGAGGGPSLPAWALLGASSPSSGSGAAASPAGAASAQAPAAAKAAARERSRRGERSDSEDEFGSDEDLPDKYISDSALSGDFSNVRGTPEPEAPKRVIKVSVNTTLGKMVQRDPQRAQKYGLVAVPPWQQNKPWPPPPVPIRPRSVAGAHDGAGGPGGGSPLGGDGGGGNRSNSPTHRHSGGSMLRRRQRQPQGELPRLPTYESEEKETALMPRGSMRKIAHIVNHLKGVRKRHTSTKMSIGHRPEVECTIATETARMHAEITLDVEASSKLLDREDIHFFSDIFSRVSAGSGGLLLRKNFQAMLKAVGVNEPTDIPAQAKFRFVQEKVLEHTRGEDSELLDPLTHPQGVWRLEEFMLMMAGLQELERQEMEKKKALTFERLTTVEPGEFNMLWELFHEFDEDGSETMSLLEMQALLKRCKLDVSAYELKHLLGCTSMDDTFDFEDFVRCTHELSDLLQIAIHRDSMCEGEEDEDDEEESYSDAEYHEGHEGHGHQPRRPAGSIGSGHGQQPRRQGGSTSSSRGSKKGRVGFSD